MSIYSLNNKKSLLVELNHEVEEAVASMYDLKDYTNYFESEISKVRITRLELNQEVKGLSSLITMVSEAEFGASIKDESEAFRKSAWKYRTAELRIVLLFNILNNEKKLSFLIRKSLEEVLHSILFHGKNEVTISQVIHRIPLKAKDFKDKSGSVHVISAWGVDELRLQLVNELAELDLIDMRVSHKTHVLNIPEAHTNRLDSQAWNNMGTKAKILSRKTILVEPAGIDKDMISKSSWWYDTPMLSADQTKFIQIMHNLKWKFVDNAEELVKEMFRKHLKVDKLPVWAYARVEEYKAQIRASHANNGHYIAGKFDSALRWYWQAEIGHTQTSEALRSLVKPLGMNNPTKYDMSNNVVQMYSVALKDRSLAKYVGLLHEDDCVEDVRSQLARYLNKHLGTYTFNKDNIKPLFMVWAYNAGKIRLLEGVYTEEANFFTGEMDRTLKVKGLRQLVKESGIEHTDDHIWLIWNTLLHKLVPSIVELKKVMNRIVKGNPFTEASWSLPDGAIAQYASVVTNNKELHWVSSNLKMRQHTHYRKELEANAKAAGLLPRMIHSMDAYMARQLVIRANALDIVVVPNHDSFMFNEQHTDIIFNLVRRLFIEIMESNTFYQIIKSYNVNKIAEGGDYLEREILDYNDILKSTPMKFEEL